MQTPFTEGVREFNEIFIESSRLNVRSYDINEKSQVRGGSVRIPIIWTAIRISRILPQFCEAHVSRSFFYQVSKVIC